MCRIASPDFGTVSPHRSYHRSRHQGLRAGFGHRISRREGWPFTDLESGRLAPSATAIPTHQVKRGDQAGAWCRGTGGTGFGGKAKTGTRRTRNKCGMHEKHLKRYYLFFFVISGVVRALRVPVVAEPTVYFRANSLTEVSCIGNRFSVGPISIAFPLA